jgi:hypothetical protein
MDKLTGTAVQGIAGSDLAWAKAKLAQVVARAMLNAVLARGKLP